MTIRKIATLSRKRIWNIVHILVNINLFCSNFKSTSVPISQVYNYADFHLAYKGQYAKFPTFFLLLPIDVFAIINPGRSV